ncbi:MAG: RdgB/HAM1 family non-canonical purine NTP pyrophosphatase [Actinomycetaceae bacterium]|nr:RdgB/HAM1 family non-canonical purine NTP pyrophosphatase [Arcanobacterium sp.]MDD7686823.1 RdgB/HAM1 family non-canonical purine NTP pyrophosphatase [Actinomycetaceae bacterium]MDY5273594.1 RdgB/HAM1 family non-canonical purine NTP pyrophosphatase [Arcanobacterium sp.]
MKPAIIFATHNTHKLQEVRAILAQEIPDLDTDLIGSAADLNLAEPVEDGLTFEQNAAIKAHYITDTLGIPAFADDSGLCVDVLGGAPGIFSARWCGHHGDDHANLALLLGQLGDIAPAHRRAHFSCAAVLAVPGQPDRVEVGQVHGTLRCEAAGSGGFGYDPIFQPDGYSATLAEMTPEQKNLISHRRRAFAALAPAVAQVLSESRDS